MLITNSMFKILILIILSSLFALSSNNDSYSFPPKMTIVHFDVNTGDSTLIISPDGKGVLIDAGDRGRGKNPISNFLDKAEEDGILNSLDYTVATHYDADHIGGMDEVYKRGWYPEVTARNTGSSLY